MLTTLFAPPPAPDLFSQLDETVLAAGLIVFAAGSLIELAFLIHYVAVAPAFRSWIGLMFVLRSTSSLLAGVAIILGRVLGPFYPGRPVLTLVLFGLIAASSLITYATFLYERYGRGRGNPFRGIEHFTRRALGLRPRVVREPCEDAEGRRLRLVRDSA